MQELAADLVARRVDLGAVITADRALAGAVTRPVPGGFRRAEPGGFVLEAAARPEGVALRVHGPPGADGGTALAAARGWAGLDDHPGEFGAVLRRHPVLRELRRRVGDPLLSRTPRAEEAVGRAVVYQLVQSEEAWRSCQQIAGRLGTPAGHGLWAWPSSAQVRAAPDWALRRCGVALRACRSLRATAVHAGRLEQARRDWALLDRRVRALPGCGVWTSGKARLALGDPDAVPVGDYNLPGLVGHVLGGGPTDDDGMLELLAPYAGHRGRVIALIGLGLRRRLLDRPRRTAPRAALSAHRYW